MTTTLQNRSTPIVLLALALVASTRTGTEAFQQVARFPSHFSLQQQQQQLPKTQLFLAKKKPKGGKAKGFGEAPAAPATKKAAAPSQPFTSPMATTPEPSQRDTTTTMQSDVTQDRPGTTRETEINRGQKALAKMRREQAEKKDAELRRVKEIRDTDKLLQSSPEAAAIPEKVAMRMGKRMLPFVGIPLFGSMGAFVAFWYFATYQNVEFEPGMVAATTVLILVSGLLVRARVFLSPLSEGCWLFITCRNCIELNLTLLSITRLTFSI